MRVDLHNHTTLCNHASGSMREYITQAQSIGIDVYGFSCHAPMPFDEKYRMSLDDLPHYIKSVRDLDGDLEILCGLEVDYIANRDDLLLREVIDAKVDYLIGSIHFLGEWGFDNPEFLYKWKDRDLYSTWMTYLHSLELLIESDLFDIIGHIDLLKIFGARPPDSVLSSFVDVLKCAKAKDLVIEINHAGLRKDINELYPSPELLRVIKGLDIDITFGSDAHDVKHVGFGYDIALQNAKDIGFEKQAIFRDRRKILIDL